MSQATIDPAALARAGVISAERLGVHPGDRVLIIWSETKKAIADAIEDATVKLGGTVERIHFATNEGYAEPTPETVEAMCRADVLFGVTAGSISHTEARRRATSSGTRTATMGGITSSIFARTVDVDYRLLQRDGEALAQMLTGSDEVHITSDQGTDLTMSIAGRAAFSEDGNLTNPGSFGNLPAGEATIAPLETEANGVLVVDGSLDGHGLVDEPVELHVADGLLKSASGSVGAAFLTALDLAGHDGRLIAELGIGTNHEARMVDNILEAEKVRGTVHIAFGASAAIGGVNAVPVHLDAVIRAPTLQIGDVTVVHAGRLLTELWSSR